MTNSKSEERDEFWIHPKAERRRILKVNAPIVLSSKTGRFEWPDDLHDLAFQIDGTRFANDLELGMAVARHMVPGGPPWWADSWGTSNYE